MTKMLTTQNAQITTAAVEVKTLTISGKQVTLAVFRQLREEPLISEDGTLNGAPWGVVNYHPDKCGVHLTEHVHVIWQAGAELLRSRVNAPMWGRYFPDFGSGYVQAVFCQNDHKVPARMGRALSSGCWVTTFTREGIACEAEDPESEYRLGHECLDAEALAELEAGLSTELADEQARRARILEQWRGLRALPQLFIAV
jgi:hypothetical protein